MSHGTDTDLKSFQCQRNIGIGRDLEGIIFLKKRKEMLKGTIRYKEMNEWTWENGKNLDERVGWNSNGPWEH